MFNDDGTVQGNIENGTYSGKWQAMPKTVLSELLR